MDASEHLDLIKKAALDQVELNKQVLDNHLAAADRIHARMASEAIVKSTTDLITFLRQNPTQPATSP